jgi:DNA-binding response OmpR family regulator
MGATRKGQTVLKNLPSVFIVDDEKTIAETLTTILQKNGFAAKSFTDPREALTAARDETPDLLLSDVMMPELSGVELAVAIRQHCPECKILLFSGHAETLDLLFTARAQGHDFHLLSKPIHPTELLRRICQQNPVWMLEQV